MPNTKRPPWVFPEIPLVRTPTLFATYSNPASTTTGQRTLRMNGKNQSHLFDGASRHEERPHLSCRGRHVSLKGSPQTRHDPSGEDYSPPNHTAAYLKNPELLYPAAARERGIEGTVLLEVLISVGGNPLIMKIKKNSGHPMLDSAALWSMDQWCFEPARRCGRAIEALIEVPIHFRRAKPPE